MLSVTYGPELFPIQDKEGADMSPVSSMDANYEHGAE
jgi:hypothetical protein